MSEEQSEPVSRSDLETVIRQRYEASHSLVQATEKPAGKAFPQGTRLWWVEHESATCRHEPRCHWFCAIYQYHGHFTLVKDMEMSSLSLNELIDRITGARAN